MNRTVAVAIALIVASFAAPGDANAAEWYWFSVSRVDQDLYRIDHTPFFFHTRFCHHFGYFEVALVEWWGGWVDGAAVGRLHWKFGSPCDVMRVFEQLIP